MSEKGPFIQGLGEYTSRSNEDFDNSPRSYEDAVMSGDPGLAGADIFPDTEEPIESPTKDSKMKATKDKR